MSSASPNGAHDARQADLAVGVRGVEALGGQVAVVRVHVGAVRVGQLELNPTERLFRDGIQLFDDEAALPLVVEAERLHLAGLDLDGLGRAVQHEPFHCLDLLRGDGGSRLQPLQHDPAILIGDELAVGITHDRPAGIGDKEGHALDGGGGALDALLDHEGRRGGVIKPQCLRVVGVHHHSLRLGVGVDGVAGDAAGFCHHQRAHHPVDGDFPVLVRVVQAVGADLAVGIGDELAGGGGHLELHPFQGLAVQGTLLQDDQRTGLAVFHHNGLGVAALADDHIGGGRVDDVPAVRRFDFGQHIGVGREIGDPDLALGIGTENAVLGERRRADDAVQPHLTARGGGDPKFSTGQRLVGGGIPFLDDQFAHGLIFEGEGDGFARLNLDGLRLGVLDEPGRCGHLGHHHGFVGLEAADTHLAVLIAAIDTVGIADEGAVGVHYLKFGILQGDAGVGGANLPNQEATVRDTFIRNHAKPLENTHFI